MICSLHKFRINAELFQIAECSTIGMIEYAARKIWQNIHPNVEIHVRQWVLVKHSI